MDDLQDRFDSYQREVVTHFNTTASLGTSGLVLDIFGRGRNNAGKPGKLKRASLGLEELDAMLLPKSCEASTDAVASSRIRIGASLRSARAMANRWRSPPDNFCPRSPISVS